jgi:hypothetical protein
MPEVYKLVRVDKSGLLVSAFTWDWDLKVVYEPNVWVSAPLGKLFCYERLGDVEKPFLYCGSYQVWLAEASDDAEYTGYRILAPEYLRDFGFQYWSKEPIPNWAKMDIPKPYVVASKLMLLRRIDVKG